MVLARVRLAKTVVKMTCRITGFVGDCIQKATRIIYHLQSNYGQFIHRLETNVFFAYIQRS